MIPTLDPMPTRSDVDGIAKSQEGKRSFFPRLFPIFTYLTHEEEDDNKQYEAVKDKGP